MSGSPTGVLSSATRESSRVQAAGAAPNAAGPSRARLLLSAGIIGAAAMLVVQSGTPWLVGNDSYYHLRMASMLPETGFPSHFPWLHWTIFRDDFVSHHHGFHALLAAPALVSDWLTDDLILGGKAASVIGLGITAALFAAVLRQLGVPHPLLWTLLLTWAPWHFWMRLAYVRAPIAALPLLLGALWLILRNRPFLLGLMGFVFAQVYAGVVLFPLVPFAMLLGRAVAREPLGRGLVHLGAAAFGVGAGLIVNPYFPQNLRFLWVQLFETGLGSPAEVGSEWKPYDAWFLLKIALPILAVWVVSLIARLRCASRTDGVGFGLLILNLAFLALTIHARRFIEYWPVFLLLNAAEWRRHVAAEATGAAVRAGRAASSRAIHTAALALLAAPGIATILMTRAAVGTTYDPGRLRPAMAYLERNSPAGAIVFTDDWDLFPYCFYFNRHNRYVVGLDPVFTMTKYPQLWERYRLITRGQAPSPIHATDDSRPPDVARLEDIRDAFEAGYVLVAADHRKLYEQLHRRSDVFRRVYPAEPWNDADAIPAFSVFEVLPGDGAAAAP